MTIGEMHYDFKQKLNKLDSQKNRNLNVPEIDWKLNEAIGIMVKTIAQPRLSKETGFEFNQRTIDDIRTIVVDQKPNEGVTVTKFDDKSFIAALPIDYWFYVNSNIYIRKDTCEAKAKTVREVQHDDEHEISIFDRSSFEWRHVNVRFNSGGFRVFTDGTFDITKVCFEYLREPKRVHNAKDWRGGSYKLIDGTVLTGFQDCDLPKTLHGEIVDLAVAITAGDLGQPDSNLKRAKLALNQVP